jgi:hypothetical protein
MTSERSRIVNRKHGMEGSSEYRIWIDMRRRCEQPQRPDFKNYGARGVTVCDEWNLGSDGMTGFEIFYRDMGPRPSRHHTIDRKDNDGPYEKNNCHWALAETQGRNRRDNRMITIDGITITVTEAAQRFGINRQTLFSRIDLGWDPVRAVKTPVKTRALVRNQSDAIK